MTVPLVRRTIEDYDLAFKVAALVATHHNLEKSYQYLLALCFKELLQNAYQHSSSANGVYTCAQVIRTRRQTRVTVLDEGIGVRRHLTQNPKFGGISSDEDAIRVALRKNTSGTGRQRGLGRFFVSRMILAVGGHISILSGESHVQVDPDAGINVTPLTATYEGTIVSVNFDAAPGYVFNLDGYED